MGTVVGRSSIRTSSWLAAMLIAAVALLAVPMVPGHAGEIDAAMALSGLIVPLDQADVEVRSARIDIRLPRGHERLVAIRMEYELVSAEDAATDLTICLPLHGLLDGIDAFTRKAEEFPPAAKFDGTPIEYSYLGVKELAAPHFDRWAERGWQLLEQTDPDLKAKLEALDGSDAFNVPPGARGAIEEHVKAHADRYGDRAKHWDWAVVKFLVYRDVLRFFWELYPYEIADAMRFLDPEYTREKYDLSAWLLDEWDMHVVHMCDPYDGRLYRRAWSTTGPLLNGCALKVLKFQVRLLPGESHRLAVFYRQHVGFDLNEYRPGDGRSRQFCIVTNNSHKWRKWNWLDMVLHWPEGIDSIAYRPNYRQGKRYWRDAGYHHASFPAPARSRNVHVAWTIPRPPPRPDDYLAQ